MTTRGVLQRFKKNPDPNSLYKSFAPYEKVIEKKQQLLELRKRIVT